ncbi:hypothetical protein ACFRMQ_32285, partial [Kitasatospora sp. NPDC056783]
RPTPAARARPPAPGGGAARPDAAGPRGALAAVAAGCAGGDDGDGSAWATLAVAFLAAPVIALAASVVTAVLSVRSGYRLLPVAAAVAPFVLPALLSSGALR